MYYKRRYTPKRRRGYRRAVRNSGRSYRYKKKRATGQKIYYFKRYTGALNGGTVTVPFASPLLIAFNFSLNDLPNATEFTSLFDMYKIKAVKVKLIPQLSESISAAGINNVFYSQRMFSAIDYNDATAPSSIDDIRQYQTCKVTSQLRPHTRIIYKPKILDSSSYSLSPWISTSSPSVDYYGLKIAAEATGRVS